ncbi:hypothetical protein GUJ93_ZPchr0006g44671 [Zizania palustris]|uniref:GTP cyclohydrolase II domain-containing protein n=1 Tax=Zizania palustris TaxID=103762 RepID=A0A8J5STI3_ZIZPA|nr:hypothetical protein GUJ93_ZPchr0006g44671 [Zizania palustris]
MEELSRELTVLPLFIVWSECLTGDILGSARCNFGNQLDLAMQLLEKGLSWRPRDPDVLVESIENSVEAAEPGAHHVDLNAEPPNAVGGDRAMRDDDHAGPARSKPRLAPSRGDAKGERRGRVGEGVLRRRRLKSPGEARRCRSGSLLFFYSLFYHTLFRAVCAVFFNHHNDPDPNLDVLLAAASSDALASFSLKRSQVLISTSKGSGNLQ